ncbi:MAG: LacI family DNA-binding transcriptional regulator [Akkermansiaceae bacterium]
MKLTLNDVAREAGVSRATVSRVVNGIPNVDAETVVSVRQTMDRMGYVRPAVRPGPKPKSTHPSRLRAGAIALIAIGGSRNLLQEPTMAQVVEEIQAACRQRQLNLMLDQMDSPDQIPLCVQTRQVDGALIMVSGRPPELRECIQKLASLVPSVHFFAPGHPVAGVDHVSVNDVAIGALAYHTLKAAGCSSFAAVTLREEFHEALLVRGRALMDRAAVDGAPAHAFVSPVIGGDPSRFWPSPLTVCEDPEAMAKAIQETLPGPVGVFVTLETFARSVHGALEGRNMLSQGGAKMIIAGSTHFYVADLQPAPALISLDFPEIIGIAIDRLIHRAVHLPSGALTFLIPPRISD